MIRGYSHNGIKRIGNMAFLRDAKAVVQFGDEPNPTLPNNSTRPDQKDVEKAAKHARGVVVPKNMGGEKGIAYASWGSNNRRPGDLLKEAKLNGILQRAMVTRCDVHYGAGPMYYKLVVDGTSEVVTPVPFASLDPEIREFHLRSQLETNSKSKVGNVEWWGTCPNEYVLSNNYEKITSVRSLRQAWVRWSLMESDTGLIRYALFNPNWNLGFSRNTTEAIPVADPFATPDEVRAWAKANGYHKFVRNVMTWDPDEGYYPDLPWHSLFDNKWLQNTNAIPLTRAEFRKNILSIKYHISVPNNYLKDKFEDAWDSFTPEEKETKRGEFLDTLNDWLTGELNQGKALVTEFNVDEIDGKAHAGWTITPIQDKYQDTVLAEIASGEKGNSEMLATTGVDPSLLGQGAPGGKLGAGSGSDKEQAIRILHAMMYGSRELSTEDWYFTRDYNGWTADLCMGYRPMELRAMDAKKPDEKQPADAS